MAPHSWPARVYYQHTDAGGVVYHGAYIDFMEAARSEMMRAMGFNLAEWGRAGILFAVHRLDITYRKPGRLGDELRILTRCVEVSGARLVLEQSVVRDGTTLAFAIVTLVCISAADFRAAPIPNDVKAVFEGDKASSGPGLGT